MKKLLTFFVCLAHVGLCSCGNVDDKDSYLGTKVELSKNAISYNKLFSFTGSSLQSAQGAAIYGDYLFQTYNTVGKIDIYNIPTGNLVGTISLTAIAAFHGNNMQFSNIFISDSDFFPVLYISSETERLSRVYRIQQENNTYTATLVQIIGIPSAEDLGYYPNCILDNEKGLMYIGSYTENSYISSDTNKLKLTSFKLPALDSDVINLTTSDIIDTFLLNSLTAMQGAFISQGKLFQAYGHHSSFSIRSINLTTKSFETYIDLVSYGINDEPEGLALYNNTIIMTSVGRHCYRFFFDVN